ncbi:hypothetical protein DVH05_021519 [Phytophthora capsici]|nr:hypothetical protein DVH05_021519 [Phytophthora capsici]
MLMYRNTLNNIRNPGIYWIRLFMYFCLSFMVGTMYLNTSDDLTEEDLVLLLFYVQAFVMFMLCAAVLHRAAHRGCARAGQQQQLAERRELRPAGGSQRHRVFPTDPVPVAGGVRVHGTRGRRRRGTLHHRHRVGSECLRHVHAVRELHDTAGTVVVADEAAVWEDAEGEVDPDVDAAMAAVLAKVTSPLEVEPAVDAAVEVEAESAACGIGRC